MLSDDFLQEQRNRAIQEMYHGSSSSSSNGIGSRTVNVSSSINTAVDGNEVITPATATSATALMGDGNGFDGLVGTRVEVDDNGQLEGEEDELTRSLPIKKKLGETVVTLEGIFKHYKIAGRSDFVRALEEINVNDNSEFYAVKRGEFVMIRGPSGGGKTTLLNIIGTIDSPSGGTMAILGEPVTDKSSDNYLADMRLRKIGFVFQTFNLIATMSAYENVELPMTLLGKLKSRQRRERAKMLLKMVGLEDRMAHLPSELSGGEQQRVTIARALANDPEILLLDEPTGDLDSRNTVEIMDLLLRINLNRKTTMIMVTHNPDVECYADRILYVRDGRFDKQILNEIQVPLVFEHYDNYLKSKK